MKRIVIVLLSISLFLTLSVSPTLAAAADSVIGTLVDCTFAGWSEVPEEARQLAQAYVDLFKSTSLKDTISCVEDIPISWLKTIGSVQYALSPASDIVYLLDESGVLEVENGHSSHGGRHRVGNEQDDVVVGGDQFKKHLDDHSTYYEPTGSTNKVSWKTDKYFSNSSYDDARSSSYFTFLDKHTFFGISGLQKCYLVPFFDNGEDLYFSNYCLYFELLFDPSGVSDTYDMLFKYVDLHNTVSDLSDPVQYLSEFEKNSYKFSDFSGVEDEGGAREILNGRLYSAFMAPHNLRFFDTFDHFLVYSYLNALRFPFPDEFDPMDKFYNSRNITLAVSDVFNEINFPACPISEAPCDWGFYISDTPILMDGMGADIDTTKIPDNYYITVSGDTIYDYSITNPETGQSSTINEYITNNYTYITNNPGGDGGGSGTTGGNVSVGGNVGVNGNVNVGGEVKFGGEVSVGVDVSPIDVNVNVSGAGDSGNGGEDPPEIGAVDDLVDYLPEKSPAINEYLKIFLILCRLSLWGLYLRVLLSR